MKYFTLDWWQSAGNPSADGESLMRPSKEYRQYFDSIQSQLPSALKNLLSTYSLHDGGLLGIVSAHNQKNCQLTLQVYKFETQGDREYKIQLRYTDIELFEIIATPDKSLSGPFGFGDLGYDEIEILAAGLYEHRFLFSGGIELKIQFQGFEYESMESV